MNTFVRKKGFLLWVSLVVLTVFGIMSFPRVAWADSDINYVVDQGGSGDFSTIQSAVNAAENTTVSNPTSITITVKPGSYSETIQIKQQANKDILLQAQQRGSVTIQGRINIDGMGRYNDAETLTIDGFAIIDQSPNDTVAACISSNNVGGASHNSYVHNLTVSNCSFDSAWSSGELNTTGLRIQSGGNGQGKNISVENCTASANMHSLMQGQGGILNITIDSCVVNGSRGVHLVPTGICEITNCTFNASGYALRFGSGGDGSALTPNCSVTLANCDLSVSNAEVSAENGVIVTRGNAPSSYTVSDCSFSNSTSGGVIWNNTNKSKSGTVSYFFSNNYWGPNGCTSDCFYGMSETALEHIIKQVNSYTIYVDYNANGGQFAGGITLQSGVSALVQANTDPDTQEVTYLMTPTFPKNPTRSNFIFTGWFTDPTDGSKVTEEGDGEGNSVVSTNTTLYAHWEADSGSGGGSGLPGTGGTDPGTGSGTGSGTGVNGGTGAGNGMGSEAGAGTPINKNGDTDAKSLARTGDDTVSVEGIVFILAVLSLILLFSKRCWLSQGKLSKP